jgi:TonB-dependent receptor
MSSFARALLASAALAPCLAAGGAIAQTEAAPAEPGVTRAEVVVVSATPIRDSIARSLAVQRISDNIVNVVAADTIGRFPDQTAAGALQRLPGAAVQRDQGQERYVQVRGAPARWTTVSFDGVNVLGAEDRIFRFDSVPASVISQLELNKTLTPEMPAESLAGRVNIRTFSPMSVKGLSISAEAGGGYGDLGDGPVSSYGLRVSWSNDKFGAVIGGSAFSFDQDTDNYEPRFDAVGMSQVRFAKYELTRETNALFGRLEYRFNPDHQIRFTGLYSEFLDAETRTQYTFNFNQGAGTRTKTDGRLVSVPVQGLFEEGNYATENQLFVLHGEHKIAGYQVSWDIGQADMSFLTNLPLIAQVQSNPLLRPSLTFRAGEAGVPVISIFETVPGATPGTRDFGLPRSSLNQRAFDTETLVIFRQFNEQQDQFAKADVSREWKSFGADATLTAGAQFNARSFDDPGNFAFLRPNGTVGTVLVRGPAGAPGTAGQVGVTWTPLDLITQRTAIGNIDVGFNVNFMDNPALRRQYDALIAAMVSANGAGGTFPVPRSNPALANTVEEDILSGYVQNIWRWERHTLLAGLRAERSEVTSSGVASVGGALVPISLSAEESFLFPSVHYTFDLTDAVKLRAAYVSGAARPSFSDLRSTVSVTDVPGFGTVTGGNPALKPETAQGVDLSAEWYFSTAGLLSAGFFHRDVKDVIFDATEVLADTRFNFNGVDRRGYTYSTVLNGGDGKLQGLELAYYHPFDFLPGAFSGLGVNASLTFLDSEFDVSATRKSALPGTSDRITAASIFYEKYGVSLRLSYQRRSEWLDELSPGAAGDLYWDATERVDFSARYAIGKHWTVYADANNLTNEKGLRYQGDKSQPYELESFGRRFLFGVRASY